MTRKPRKLIPLKELGPLKGITYSAGHIRRLINMGLFPQPVRIGFGPNAQLNFDEEEIDALIEQRKRARTA